MQIKLSRQSGLFRGMNRGFSIAEMLVMIAILAVISVIAISALSNITSSSTETRNKRNAQTIARTASSAIASGVTEICECATVLEAITRLESGVSPGGEMSLLVFRIPLLTQSEKEGAANYLLYDDGLLVYSPTKI